MGDVFVRYRLGRRYESDVWAVFLHDQPVDLAAGGWAVTAVVAGQPDHVWRSSNAITDGPRVVIGSTSLELDGATVVTSTVQLSHLPQHTETWQPFTADFEVVIDRAADTADAQRYTVLEGYMRADDLARFDERVPS